MLWSPSHCITHTDINTGCGCVCAPLNNLNMGSVARLVSRGGLVHLSFSQAQCAQQIITAIGARVQLAQPPLLTVNLFSNGKCKDVEFDIRYPPWP